MSWRWYQKDLTVDIKFYEDNIISVLDMKYLILIHIFSFADCGPPPIRNLTTITLYTDVHSWHDANAICSKKGGRLLDIEYYSLFNILLTLASQSPWNDLPICNGPPAWIGMHRKVTALGDHYYGSECSALDDFRIIYWNAADPYKNADGDPEAYCINHEIIKTVTETQTTYSHDYSQAKCSGKSPFYCTNENGPCRFKTFQNTMGDTSTDFTPENDVEYPYETDDACAELCYVTSAIFPHPDLLVVEECWGFTVNAISCRLHVVVKSTFFDNSVRRLSSIGSTLFVKRCFESAVNKEVFSVVDNNTSELPDTDCGIYVLNNSSMTSPEVAFYPGNWTWNEAFTTCMDRGMLLLNIDNDSTYVALQQLHNKYNNEINRFLWLGLHEPSPITDPDIRVWSHCLAPGSTNWDSRRPPSPNQADTALCTVINVTSTLWYTVECTQRHGFVCTGTRATGQWSYDFGTAHNIGAGVSLGPYNVSNVNCERMCNDKEFETQQCWAFTLREGANECHLHFTDDATFENVSVTTVTESYVLYRKLIWKESLHTTTKVAADTGIFPVSCCNVSTIPSLCPSNNVPEFDSDIPTTVKQDLVLHTTPASFSVAFKTCNSYNGHLIRVSQLSKLKLLTRFMAKWSTNGQLTGHVWIGLTETRPVDPCSLQWTRDCLVPEWTNFLDSTYTSAGNKTCVAIDTTGSFVKRSCSDQLQFLCEIDIGPCDFLDVVPDHLCQVGALGLSYTEPTATCQSTCSTTVHGDMECWNFVKTGPTSCALFFYQDPGQCHDSFTFKRNNDAVFKTCYISSTHSINTDAMLPTIEPLTVCPATSNYPYIPPEKHYCDVSSTSTAILIYPSSSSFSTDDISSSSLIDVSSPVSSSGYIASTSAPDVPFLTSTANVAITTSLLGASFSTPTPDAILSISTSDAILSTSTTDTILSTHETATTVSTSIIDAFILTSLTDSILSTGTRFISSITTTDSIWSAPTSAVNPIAQTTSADKFAVVSATNVIIESSAAEISYSTFSDDIVSSVSSLDDSETTLPLNSIATTYFEMTTDSSFLTETTSLTHASATTSSTAMITTTLRSITPQVSEMTTKPTKYITPIYIWPCLCHLYNKTNLTFEEWEKWLAHTLEMPKNRTKRYMRSKVSVCDTRTSALAIGIITSSLMLGIAIYLLSSDIPRLIKSVKYIHRCNKTEAYRKRANIDTQQKF